MSTGWACVIRFGGVGDNLMAASVLRPLKRLGYKVEVITSDSNHVVFHNNPFIDKLAVLNTDRDLPKGGAGEWVKWMNSRAREYDVFAHLSHSCEARHAFNDTMTSFWWPVEYRRKMCAGSYLETACDIAQVPYDFGRLFFPTDDEMQRATATKRDQIGPRCIGWILSGTRIDKVYPYAAMAIARLIKETNIPVLVTAALNQREYDDAKAIQDHVERTNGTRDGLCIAMSDPGTNSGDLHSWPLRRILTQLQLCDLVITVDTGPAWAVAMEPMPKVMLHSHASVENICKHWVNTTSLHADPERVPCWPCHRLHNGPETCVPNKDNKGAACISDISVEKLLSTVRELWSANVRPALGEKLIYDGAAALVERLPHVAGPSDVGRPQHDAGALDQALPVEHNPEVERRMETEMPA